MSKKKALIRVGFVAAMVTSVTFGAVAPAHAEIRDIDRSSLVTFCKFRAESYVRVARTVANANNECDGHGWVRVRLNGSSSYGAWVHGNYGNNSGEVRAPSGRTIVSSQHKTCSNCDVFTLNAS